MALKSGNGGSVQLGTGSIVVVPVGRWSGNWRFRDAEVTQSDSGGCSLYFGVIQDNEWEFSVCRDDTLYPEVLGLVQGSNQSVMWFKLGAGVKADKLTNTYIAEIAPVVDNTNDVVRVSVRGKGGLLTPNQTIA